MKYVQFNKINDNRTLRITLLDEGREYIKERVEDGIDVSFDGLFYDLIEYQLANGWESVSPLEIGAMTEANLLSDNIERDDHGKILNVDFTVYSDIAFYQVFSPTEKMLENGYVDFQRA